MIALEGSLLGVKDLFANRKVVDLDASFIALILEIKLNRFRQIPDRVIARIAKA